MASWHTQKKKTHIANRHTQSWCNCCHHAHGFSQPTNFREHMLYERTHSIWENTFYMRTHFFFLLIARSLCKRKHSVRENTFYVREHLFSGQVILIPQESFELYMREHKPWREHVFHKRKPFSSENTLCGQVVLIPQGLQGIFDFEHTLANAIHIREYFSHNRTPLS